MTTIATYLSITKNLSRTQARTAAEPAVKTASAYYAANIGKITSIKQFVGNYRLLSYALDAYGLGSQINSTALIKKVLEGGVANSKALANTLPQWKAFATAFDFVGKGAASISTATAIAATKQNYIEQQLENDEGQQDVGVQLALYFHRVAPNVTSAFGILADKNLLQVVVLRRKHRHAGQGHQRLLQNLRSAQSHQIEQFDPALHRSIRFALWPLVRVDRHFDGGRVELAVLDIGLGRRARGARRNCQFARLQPCRRGRHLELQRRFDAKPARVQDRRVASSARPNAAAQQPCVRRRRQVWRKHPDI
jgi:hypothetical protein